MDASLFLSVQTFMLAFARVGGILGSGPFFGGRSIPTMFKVLMALFITLLVAPTLHPAAALPQSVLGLCLVLVRELALGIAVGLVAQLVFTAVQMSGELLGMQMGFSMMNLVDPSSGASMPVIAQLYGLFATLVFFLLDAHHIFVRGVFLSFQLAPIGASGFSPQLAASVVSAVGSVFVMAFELAGPVLAALFLTDVALGLVARTLPQMNIFTVGFPLKILLGLVTLGATLPLLLGILQRQFGGMELAVRQILHGM